MTYDFRVFNCEKIALWGSILGASIYFCFTFVPMFIAYSATLIDPERFTGLLAPSVAFSENIVRGFLPGMGNHEFLRVMRITIVVLTLIVLGFALYSSASIFTMVENAYKVTLAGAFWRRATTQGALTAIFGGLSSWILVEVPVDEASLVPPQLSGLGISILGMVAGSRLPQLGGRATPQEDIHGALHHRAAAETHHAVDRPHQH